MRPEHEVDLLVIGGGVAGLCAALVAAIEGQRVMVCEKCTLLGGTAATSAGTVWIPGSHQAQRAGLADPLERAQRYLQAEVPTEDGAELRAAFLASGPQVLDYLEQHSHLRFAPARRHPDYHDRHAGAAIGGRALVALPFDGRLLGADFARLRPPLPHTMALGGMSIGKDDLAPLLKPFASWAALRHVLGLLGRHARDRLQHPRGTRLVMGNALIGRLLLSLHERAVPVHTGVAVRQLHQAQGAVTGATLTHEGQAWRVHARRGVVLACGGFGHARDWRERLLPEAAMPHSLMAEGNTGDGLRLAQSVGAAVDEAGHHTPAFWVPVSLRRRPGEVPQRFAHFALDRAKPGLIAVDARGQRFANEGDSYHDFVLAMLHSPRAVPAHLICDAVFLRRYGLGLVRPGAWRVGPFVRDGYLQRAPTLAVLAAQLGIDPEGLQATVARANAFAQTGVDEDFGKGGSELNRFNGDPAHGPNPCLGPIATPPFYAVTVWPGDAGMSVGLRTDADARVLDERGEAIEGLYACGADMSSVMRGRYPGPGVTLGPALVFAWRAAMHAAHAQGRGGPIDGRVEEYPDTV